MPKTHLTDSVVETLKRPEKGQILYWDDELKGFGVRVVGGAQEHARQGKTFIVQGHIDGKDVRIKLGKCTDLTTQEARKMAKAELGDLAKKINHNAERSALLATREAEKKAAVITVQRAFDDYCAARDLRDKTKILYTDSLVRFFSDWLETPMTDITREMVRERYALIVEKVAAASEKKSVNSKNRAIAAAPKGKAQASLAMRFLSSLFVYAAEKYENNNRRAVVTENPVKALSVDNKKWRTVPRRQSVILPTELASFYAGVRTLRSSTARDYLLFLVLTGLRRRESAQLTWSEVDLNNRSITIPDWRTKNKRPHGLPLSDFLTAMLQRRKEVSQGQFVFPSRKEGGFFDDPSSSIETVQKHMGKEFSCHDCRRTFITVAESLDIPYMALQALLNHSSTSVTSGYIVTNIERLRAPMQRITDYMLEKMSHVNQDL